MAVEFGGYYDIGYNRDVNEDYVLVRDVFSDPKDNSKTVTFAAIADGMGSIQGEFQPAMIALNETMLVLLEVMKDPYGRELITQNAGLFLKTALYAANRVMGGFKLGDEKRSGYGACVTCCLFYDNKYTFVHTGNTRCYLLRVGADGLIVPRQITVDHTKAATLVSKGMITAEEYHTHPDNLIVTSGLGVLTDPEIQMLDDAPLREKDILFLTTDGVHCSIRPEAMTDIVLGSRNCAEASESLVKAAVMQKLRADNMSALVIWRRED
jgi:protein phosphatase